MVDQNAEIIYYMYNDVNELIGIDKAVSSSIMMIMSENGIDKIRFITDPEGMLYPESFLEENEKFLEGFISRENEKINKKEGKLETQTLNNDKIDKKEDKLETQALNNEKIDKKEVKN